MPRDAAKCIQCGSHILFLSSQNLLDLGALMLHAVKPLTKMKRYLRITDFHWIYKSH